MTGEFLRCPDGESPVRTTHIVFPSPSFDELSIIFQIAEPVRVKALGAEGSVERLKPAQYVKPYLLIHARNWRVGVRCQMHGSRETNTECHTNIRCQRLLCWKTYT
jgi:hypothetical protein